MFDTKTNLGLEFEEVGENTAPKSLKYLDLKLFFDEIGTKNSIYRFPDVYNFIILNFDASNNNKNTVIFDQTGSIVSPDLLILKDILLLRATVFKNLIFLLGKNKTDDPHVLKLYTIRFSDSNWQTLASISVSADMTNVVSMAANGSNLFLLTPTHLLVFDHKLRRVGGHTISTKQTQVPFYFPKISELGAEIQVDETYLYYSNQADLFVLELTSGKQLNKFSLGAGKSFAACQEKIIILDAGPKMEISLFKRNGQHLVTYKLKTSNMGLGFKLLQFLDEKVLILDLINSVLYFDSSYVNPK